MLAACILTWCRIRTANEELGIRSSVGSNSCFSAYKKG